MSRTISSFSSWCSFCCSYWSVCFSLLRTSEKKESKVMPRDVAWDQMRWEWRNLFLDHETRWPSKKWGKTVKEQERTFFFPPRFIGLTKRASPEQIVCIIEWVLSFHHKSFFFFFLASVEEDDSIPFFSSCHVFLTDEGAEVLSFMTLIWFFSLLKSLKFTKFTTWFFSSLLVLVVCCASWSLFYSFLFFVSVK